MCLIDCTQQCQKFLPCQHSHRECSQGNISDLKDEIQWRFQSLLKFQPTEYRNPYIFLLVCFRKRFIFYLSAGEVYLTSWILLPCVWWSLFEVWLTDTVYLNMTEFIWHWKFCFRRLFQNESIVWLLLDTGSNLSPKQIILQLISQ